MKIYMDITNVPVLKHLTGISRVVTEIVINLISRSENVCLLSYNNKKRAYQIINNDAFILRANDIVADSGYCYADEYISVDEFENNSIFLEFNSAWHTMPNRSWLLPKLKSKQIRIIVLIYDIIPILFPYFLASQALLRFMEFLYAHLVYADDIIVTAAAVKDDIIKLCGKLDIPVKPIHVIGLGSDFSLEQSITLSINDVDKKIVDKLKGKKFILTVGSVEPRKNHKIIVEVYEKMLEKSGIDLVIVGRENPKSDELVNRVKSNKKFGNGIYLFSDVNDATLDYLYKKAFFMVFPSYAEGYGLPTIEALIRGTPVLCSDISVMREVGGDFCDYFDPDSADSLIAVITKYLNDDLLYQKQKEKIKLQYSAPKWNDTVDRMLKVIHNKEQNEKFPHKPIKQIVYLSARPAPLLATLPYVECFMPFITEAVVCCPNDMAEYLDKNYHGRLKLITVTDDELLNGRKLPPDHSTRNFLLRCLAMGLEKLDDEFIMSDDDYRPLKYISEEVFYKDGRYIGYFFSDGMEWEKYTESLFSFDYSMFRTCRFLKSNGYPVLLYASHQPQIINKIWYRELIAEYPDIIYKGFCEWTTYFNYISVKHGNEFMSCPYITLSWPIIGGPDKGQYQSDYIFENFYDECYSFSKPFSGYSSSFTNAEALLKENEAKRLIALKYKTIWSDAECKWRLSYKEYENKKGETPDIAVFFAENERIRPDIGSPDKYTFFRRCYNKILIGISRSGNISLNVYEPEITIRITDKNNTVYFSKKIIIQPTQNYTFERFNLSNVPSNITELKMLISVNAHKCPEAKKTIPIEIR